MQFTQWAGFREGTWQNEINVRDFIMKNVTPYHGDDSFLAPTTPRTDALFAKVRELFREEL